MASALIMADVDLVRSATLSMTNEDPDFPVENAQDDDPGLPAKATLPETVITITLPVANEPEVLVIINHNLEGATVVLANGVGFSESVTVPDRTRSGLCINIFFDMRGLANRNDDAWTLTVTGASADVAFGRIILAASVEQLFVEKDSLKIRPDHLTSEPLRTFFGKTLKFDKAVRQRAASLALRTIEDQAVIAAAEEAAHGKVVPWVFVPDEDVNDAWFVEFESVDWSYIDGAQRPASASVREISMGPHLYGVEAT